MDRDDVKLQSPHPALQAVLPRLSALSPRKDVKPVFDNREDAENFLEIVRAQEDEEYHLNPVWAIDHSDLSTSEITGWSVTRFIC